MTSVTTTGLYFEDEAELDPFVNKLHELQDLPPLPKRFSMFEKEQLVHQLSKLSSKHTVEMLDSMNISFRPGESIPIDLTQMDDRMLEKIQGFVHGTKE